MVLTRPAMLGMAAPHTGRCGRGHGFPLLTRVYGWLRG
ncbi:hypothetical protein DUI70_3745 [Streptomyces albus]|nr:hypothetical protein DUI70_3745 [Streptomyces albus]